MDPQTLARSLGEQKLIAELAPEHVEFLAGCTANQRLRQGDYLFHEGDEADKLYFVRKGKLSLEIQVVGRGTVVVETLHAGEVIGWSTIFPPYLWYVDARAVKDALVFAVDGACLRAKLEADHGFGYAFTRLLLRVVHRRLERARLQVLDVYKAAP